MLPAFPSFRHPQISSTPLSAEGSNAFEHAPFHWSVLQISCLEKLTSPRWVAFYSYHRVGVVLWEALPPAC